MNGSFSQLERDERKLALDGRTGQERDEAERADGDDRRGLADRTRQAENHAGQNAARGIRQDVILRHLPPRRAETIRRLADRLRHGANRLARRNDDDRQDQQRQRQASRRDALPQIELVDEQTERQQAVDDRRHTRQIRHIDFDDGRKPVLGRVLLEIDRRGNAHRNGAHGGHEHDERCADPRRENAGALGVPRSKVRKEIPAEARRAVLHQIDEQDREHRQAHEHDDQTDEHEDLVEQLAAREPAAQRLPDSGRRGRMRTHQ